MTHEGSFVSGTGIRNHVAVAVVPSSFLQLLLCSVVLTSKKYCYALVLCWSYDAVGEDATETECRQLRI